MEQKYKSKTIFDFQRRFPDEESCLAYLSEQKWQNGFVCRHCGHSHFFEIKTRGVIPFSRQCTRCRYTESPTAGTLFHKVKFSLLKAFYIVYYVSTNKKVIRHLVAKNQHKFCSSEIK